MRTVPRRGQATSPSALASYRDIASDLASDLASYRDIASDLDSGLVSALGSGLVSDRDLASNLARGLANNLANGYGRGRGLANNLTHGYGRYRGLANNLTRDLGLARGLARDIASELASELDGGLPGDLGLATNVGLRGLADIIARAIARADDLAIYLGSDNARAAQRQRGAGRVAPLAGRLLAAAAHLLPAGDRARYAEEFRSELAEIARARAGRRPQLAYAARQVASAWRLRTDLRTPRARKAAP